MDPPKPTRTGSGMSRKVCNYSGLKEPCVQASLIYFRCLSVSEMQTKFIIITVPNHGTLAACGSSNEFLRMVVNH